MKYKDIFYKISAFTILLSAVLYLVYPGIASWIMVVSVVVFTVTTAMSPYPGKSIRGKRLYNFQIISCLLMFVAAYFMFEGDNLWALFMLIAALFMLYSAIQLPAELKKEGYKPK